MWQNCLKKPSVHSQFDGWCCLLLVKLYNAPIMKCSRNPLQLALFTSFVASKARYVFKALVNAHLNNWENGNKMTAKAIIGWKQTISSSWEKVEIVPLQCSALLHLIYNPEQHQLLFSFIFAEDLEVVTVVVTVDTACSGKIHSPYEILFWTMGYFWVLLNHTWQ